MANEMNQGNRHRVSSKALRLWTSHCCRRQQQMAQDGERFYVRLYVVRCVRLPRRCATSLCHVTKTGWLTACLAWPGLSGCRVCLSVPAQPQDRNILGKYLASAAVCFRPTLMAFEIMSGGGGGGAAFKLNAHRLQALLQLQYPQNVSCHPPAPAAAAGPAPSSRLVWLQFNSVPCCREAS